MYDSNTGRAIFNGKKKGGQVHLMKRNDLRLKKKVTALKQ